MPRVVGIDVGTVTVDICGLADNDVFVAESLPTAVALADPMNLIERVTATGPVDLAVAPSGYGLPLTSAQAAVESDLRLASLSPRGDNGGIRGFRALLQAFAAAPFPAVFAPGVIHLESVPRHRKINRVDMGTADKVCACALAIHEEARRKRCLEEDVSFLFVELGGAFSAVLAVKNGRIIDGLGGTSGPMGMAAAGALDGEVAYLAGRVTKQMLFTGGVRSIAGEPLAGEALPFQATASGDLAFAAYVESLVKAIVSLAVIVPGVRDIVVSGRLAADDIVRSEMLRRLAPVLGKVRLHVLKGFAEGIKQGAQGAALIADGLQGGAAAGVVNAMQLHASSGTALDHLYIIGPDAARRRLGLS